MLKGYGEIVVKSGKKLYHGSTFNFDVPRPGSFFAVCPEWSWRYVTESRGEKEIYLMSFQTIRDLKLLNLATPLFHTAKNVKLWTVCGEGEPSILEECKRRGLDGWVSNDHVSPAKYYTKYEVCLLDPSTTVKKISFEYISSPPYELSMMYQLAYLFQ